MSADHLLDLPTELLVLICTFVGDHNLRHVRLSCKTLDHAAFDHWADTFLKNKESRLGKDHALPTLRSILASPHLARKMRVVSFSIEYFDFVDIKRHENGRTSSISPGIRSVITRTSEIPFVIALLEGLKATSCDISVRVRSYDRSEQYAVLTHNFFCAILCAGVKVVSYDLLEIPFDVELLTCPGFNNIATLSKDVVSIAYEGYSPGALDHTAAVERSRGVLELIRHACKLQRLRLQLGDAQYYTILGALISRAFFLAIPGSSLSELLITNTTCFTEDMLALLDRMSKILRTFRMIEVVLVSDSRRFVEVLSRLQACSDLTEIGMHSCREDVRGLEYPAMLFTESDGGCRIEVGYNVFDRWVAWEGRQAVQHMLRVNISQWPTRCDVPLPPRDERGDLDESEYRY